MNGRPKKEKEKRKENILTMNLPVKIARSGSDTYYASSIQDVREDYFAVMLPYNEGRPLILNSGEEVWVSFVRDKARYLFSTTVLRRQKENNLLFYLLKLPEEIEEVQNRLYVRLPVVMPVWLADPPKEKEEPVFRKTKTLDLSAGGMKVVDEKRLPKGTPLLVKFSLPLPAKDGSLNLVEFNTRARVVYCETVVNGKLYHVGIEFLDFKENQRDKIFSFIFREMAKRRI